MAEEHTRHTSGERMRWGISPLKRRAGSKVRPLTGKQLHKLSREDLLKLLLAQSQELSEQKETVAALQEENASAEESLGRLKSKLDEKDAQIERLKRKLDEKDRMIGSLGGRPAVDAGTGPVQAAPAAAGAAAAPLEAENRALRVKVKDQEELMRRMLRYIREKDAEIVQLKKRRPIGTEAIPADKLPPQLAEFLKETASMLDSFCAQVSEKEAQLSALPYEDGGEE